MNPLTKEKVAEAIATQHKWPQVDPSLIYDWHSIELPDGRTMLAVLYQVRWVAIDL